MESNAAAYYLWPTVWVGAAPPTQGAYVDLSKLGDEVYRRALTGGIAAKVLREGLFVFDFSGWGPGQAASVEEFDALATVILKRVNVLNAHLACLYAAIFERQKFSHEKMTVSPSELIASKSLDDPGQSYGDLRVAALAQARYKSTYSLPQMADWRVAFRTLVVEVETVADSFTRLDAILEHKAPYTLTVADLYLRGSKAYEDHDYNLSLVTGWTITEKLLQQLWQRYVAANRKRRIDGAGVTFINIDRKEKLTESRDFNASVISEVLSLVEVLPLDLYQDLSTVRQARNNWMHGLESVSRQVAQLSLQVAERMLSTVDGLSLKMPLSSRLHS